MEESDLLEEINKGVKIANEYFKDNDIDAVAYNALWVVINAV